MRSIKSHIKEYPFSIFLSILYLTIFIFLLINNLVDNVFGHSWTAQFTLSRNFSSGNLLRFFTWIFIHNGITDYILNFLSLVAVSFILESKLKTKQYIKIFLMYLFLLNVLSLMRGFVNIRIYFFGFEAMYFILLGALLKQRNFESTDRFLKLFSGIMNLGILLYIFVFRYQLHLNLNTFSLIYLLGLTFGGYILGNMFYEYETPQYKPQDISKL